MSFFSSGHSLTQKENKAIWVVGFTFWNSTFGEQRDLITHLYKNINIRLFGFQKITQWQSLAELNLELEQKHNLSLEEKYFDDLTFEQQIDIPNSF